MRGRVVLGFIVVRSELVRHQFHRQPLADKVLDDPGRVRRLRLNHPGVSGDFILWEGWSHVVRIAEDVPAGVA